MKRQKLHYNALLRRYMKNVRRLHSLRAANRNERRQKILVRHIERLLDKLKSLKLSVQKGALASTIAIGAIAMTPNSAEAQSFGPVQMNPFNLTDVGERGFSNPTLGDLDGDGDLDMISGQFYYSYDYNSYTYIYEGNFLYYENTGTSANPDYAAPQTNPFGLTPVSQYEGIAPTLVDLDNDGDLDIMLNNNNAEFLYYENIGTPAAPNFAAPLSNPFSLSLMVFNGGSQPSFADLDNDSDLDMIIGNDQNSDLFYFENTGSATIPLFDPVQTNPFSLTTAGSTGYLYHPKLVDLDGDGDFDILAGTYLYDYDNSTPDGRFRYFENTGTAALPVFAAQVENPFGLEGTQYGFGLDVADIDADGDLDIIAGQEYYYEGDFYVWEGCTPTSNTITTSAACQYTAPSGAIYSASGTFVDVIPNAANCDSIITINLTIDPIAEQTFTNNAITVCENESATLELSSSQNNLNYYLRNDLNDTVVDGPITGDGNAISFNTGDLTTSTTYNVYAFKPTVGLAFDGQNDYADAPNINLDNNSFTIEFWAKRANTGGDDYIIAQGNNSTNNGLHVGYRGNNQITFAFFGNDLNTSNTFTSTDWHHIAVTYDNTTGDRIIYVDGNQEETDNSASPYNGSGDLRIGSTPWGSGGGDDYQGNIDELRIWSTVRSAAEIMNNMNTCLTGTETDLISYYQFESGTGTVASDLTTNGNDATFAGDTNWGEGSTVCGSCEIVMTQTATVTVNSLPTVNVPAGDEEVCIGETVNITPATGGTWMSSDPTVATITNTGEVESLTAGTADMTFTDGITGCTNEPGTATILVNPDPTVSIPAGDEEICLDETVNITPNSGGTWMSSDAAIATITNTGEVEGITAGSADMTFTDGTTGCSNDAGTATITVNPLPTVSIPAGDEEICVDETVNITPNSGGTWMSSDDAVATITNAGEVNGISAGSADMTFTDGTTGCSNDAGTASITVNPLPAVTIPAGDEEICIGEMVNITPATGGTWMSSDAAVATITNTGDVEGVTAGSVDMTFTDGTTGCSNDAGTASITVNPNPTVNIAAGDEEICIGEMVNITPATGGTWASSDAAIATITNAGEVDGISAGTVDMTFTDGTTGCSNEAGTATITVNPAVDITVTNNTTSLTANATGASYQWLNCDDNNSIISGATSQTFTPTSNGNYAVEVTENGCSDTSDCEAITVLSIDENAFGANINIYPNPTKGIINIDLGQEKSANLKLVSVQGREIFSKDVNEANVTVDISRYPQGVYILRISEGKNESFHRIIKN